MKRAAVFAIPGDLRTRSGGYAYAREILRRLPDLAHLPLTGGFPLPTDAELANTAIHLAALPGGVPVLLDGLALGALPDACLDRLRGPAVALVHHPLCLETGLPDAERDRLRRSERRALARCAHVIATSTSTAGLLEREFGVPPDRLTVAEPGTEPAARSPLAGKTPDLLAVGSVVRRKGYDVLLRALELLCDLPWTLTIAGALDRDPAAVAALREAIAAPWFAGRITLAGAVDIAQCERLFAAAGIFVSASWHEGYGMAVAEAMARGLPLVATTAGALCDTIPKAAALTCAPGDVDGLAAALRRMLTDAPLRLACARASWVAGQALPRWEQTAARIADVLDRVRPGSA